MVETRVSSSGRIVSQAMSSGAILEAVKAVASEGDDKTYVRLLRPSMEPVEIDSKKTVIAAILGDKYGIMFMDRMVYKSRLRGFHMMVLWLLGGILGMLSLFNLLPPYYSIIGGGLAIPCILLMGYSFLNVTMVKILLRRFNTWYK